MLFGVLGDQTTTNQCSEANRIPQCRTVVSLLSECVSKQDMEKCALLEVKEDVYHSCYNEEAIYDCRVNFFAEGEVSIR